MYKYVSLFATWLFLDTMSWNVDAFMTTLGFLFALLDLYKCVDAGPPDQLLALFPLHVTTLLFFMDDLQNCFKPACCMYSFGIMVVLAVLSFCRSEESIINAEFDVTWKTHNIFAMAMLIGFESAVLTGQVVLPFNDHVSIMLIKCCIVFVYMNCAILVESKDSQGGNALLQERPGIPCDKAAGDDEGRDATPKCCSLQAVVIPMKDDGVQDMK